MYKVGDKVRIKSIDWYNENKDENGIVELSTHVFIPEMVEHCGTIVTIKDVFEDIDDNVVYYMEDIVWDWTDEMIECLVERNGKTYPYKIGDRVILKGNNRLATITDLKYNSFGNLSYYIKIDNDKDISTDCPTDLLLPYDNIIKGLVEEETKAEFKIGDKITNGKVTLTILTLSSDRYVVEDNFGECGTLYFNSQDEWKIVKEEIKSKFKVGDRIITDTNMKGTIIEVVEKGWYRVEFEPHNNIPQPNGIVPEENMLLMEEKCNYVQADNIPDITQAKTSSACSHNGFYGYSDSDGNEISEWNLPEGYQFIDENGNVINTTKIVLEKKYVDDDKLKLESTKKVREYWSEYARIFIEIYDDEPNECTFTHLWVVDGQRQKGHGKRALIEAETIAKELGCHTAFLKVETNSWMHHWYLRCGYQWYENAPDNYTWLTKDL